MSIGYEKIESFRKRAAQDDFCYGWMDTCCINKESSVDLSEAINSMFCWYQRAGFCCTYLMDVPPSGNIEELSTSLKRNQWFTWGGGWTLQELIAPSNILSLASDWTDIGWESAFDRTDTY